MSNRVKIECDFLDASAPIAIHLTENAQPIARKKEGDEGYRSCITAHTNDQDEHLICRPNGGEFKALEVVFDKGNLEDAKSELRQAMLDADFIVVDGSKEGNVSEYAVTAGSPFLNFRLMN